MAREFPWIVEPLGARHDRESFDCGVPALNEFLKKFARQNEELDLSRTTIARRPDDPRVLGYFSLSAGLVNGADLPAEEARRFPRHPVPVVRLARLAVDRTVQGRRLGCGLLVRALEKAYRVSLEIGAFAVEVQATHEAVREFHLRNGFKELHDDRLHLFIAMKTVRKLFE